MVEDIVLAIAGRRRPRSLLGYYGSPDRDGMGCHDRLRHFQTLPAVGDRLYAGVDGRIYAFSF